MKDASKKKIWAFWISLIIVAGSHLYMLVYGLPPNQIVPHSILNLVAAGLFTYIWFGSN